MTKRTYGGPLVDVTGAVDLHCHPFPDLFPRLADDFNIVRAARDAGMKAILLKCHHENTVSRAYLVQRVIPGIRVFGGIVLNYYVGGINPAAVEASLRLGGKEVWMPTVDAGYHAEVHGGTGGYDNQQGGRRQAEGIWVEDKEGKLRPEVKEVLELVAQHGAILGTSHLAPREIVALVREARSVGVEKIVITHPYFRVPNLDLDTLEEVARMGAMPEFGYCTVSPAWQYAAPEKIVQSVDRIGASRCLLVSDTGQRHNPLPSEALRIFAQTIFEKGVPMEQVTKMITTTRCSCSTWTPTSSRARPTWPGPAGWSRTRARPRPRQPCRAEPVAIRSLPGRRRRGSGVPFDALTVREMLGEDAMRGARIIAGAGGLDRVVTCLNVMTVPNIVRWTKQDEFLLTTGYPLPRQPAEFCQLIEQLAANGLAGLGVKLDEYLAEVPQAAVDLADRAAFPIIVIPAAQPLDDVLSQTFETIVNRQATALVRRQQIHDALLGVALTGGGLARLSDELAEILPGANVVICDPAGYPLAATTRSGPRHRLPRRERPGEHHPAGPGRARGRRDRDQLGRGLIRAGDLRHGFVLAVGGAQGLPGVAGLAVEQAALVAALQITRDLAVLAVEQQFASNALHNLVTGTAADMDQALARAVRFGWDLQRPLAVLVARQCGAERGDDASRPQEASALRAVELWTRAIRDKDRNAAVAGFATELVAVVGIADAAALARKVHADMTAATGRAYSVGVSQVAAGPAGHPAPVRGGEGGPAGRPAPVRQRRGDELRRARAVPADQQREPGRAARVRPRHAGPGPRAPRRPARTCSSRWWCCPARASTWPNRPASCTTTTTRCATG